MPSRLLPGIDAAFNFSSGLEGESMTAKLVLTILAFASLSAVMPDAHAQDKWEMAPPMPRAMGEVVEVAVQRSIFVFGGLNDAAGEVPYGAAYQYDVDTEHWTALQDMPEPAHHLMATNSGGKHVDRFVQISKNDTMRFEPSSVAFVQGETVEFDIKNDGHVVHVFVFDT